jgi:hypothetical protein
VSCVANDVKCHVSSDMAVIELNGPISLFKKHTDLVRLRAQACDLRPLAFVFVSGTALAPTES